MLDNTTKIRVTRLGSNQLAVRWNQAEIFSAPYVIYTVSNNGNIKSTQKVGITKYLMVNLSYLILFWVGMSIYESEYSIRHWLFGLIFVTCITIFLLFLSRVIFSGIDNEVSKQTNKR